MNHKHIIEILVNYKFPFFALSCVLIWAFLLRYSSLIFQEMPNIRSSNTVSICILIILVLGTLIFQQLNHIIISHYRYLFIIISAICGITATIIPFILTVIGIDVEYGLILMGILLGISFLCCTIIACQYRNQLTTYESLVIAAASFTVALLIYVLASWIFSFGNGFLVALMPLLSAILIIFDSKYHKSLSLRNEYHSFLYISHSVHFRNKNMRLIYIFLIGIGLFVVFVPTIYPKTTNCAPELLGSESCFGLSSYRCIVAILLCTIALWLGVYLIGHTKLLRSNPHSLELITLIILIVFALVFFFLPSSNTNGIPFVLLTVLSIIFALFAINELFRIANRQNIRSAHIIKYGLIIFYTSGLIAAIFSFIFLDSPLEGTFFYDQLLKSIPAILIIFCAFLTFLLQRNGLLDFSRNQMSVTDHGESYTFDINNQLDRSINDLCNDLKNRFELTNREFQVLILIAEGRNEPYIEAALQISRTTVKTHITHIYHKVGVNSRQELIDMIYEQ